MVVNKYNDAQISLLTSVGNLDSSPLEVSVSSKYAARGAGVNLTELKIERRPLSTLRQYDRNARTYSKKQAQQIADSIRRFGFTNPVLIADDGSNIAASTWAGLFTRVRAIQGIMSRSYLSSSGTRCGRR